MTYLSYQLVNGVATAVAHEGIDDGCKFTPNGTIYVNGYPGFNVCIFGGRNKGGVFIFNRHPIFTEGYDQPPGDFGILEPQAAGTVAIRWPV